LEAQSIDLTWGPGGRSPDARSRRGAGGGLRRTVWSLALLTATAACAVDTSLLPRAEVSDSAGVRLVSYDLSGIEVPTYRSLGSHDLEIGALDGPPEYTLSAVVDLALMHDGTIVLSDRSVQAARLYGRDGGYLRTVGQAGEGPGEFAQAPLVAGSGGDTVFLFDPRNVRVTTFLAGGDLVETVSFGGGARVRSLLRLDDGNLLSRSRWSHPDSETTLHDLRLELDSTVVLQHGPDGESVDTVMVVPDRNRVRTIQGAGDRLRVLDFEPPFASRAVLETNGSVIVSGRSNEFVLTVERADTPDVRLRVRGVQHTATSQEIAARQEANVREEAGDQPVDPRILQANLDYLPERLPAFGDVVVGSAGDVWVSRTEFDLSEGLEWLVFAPGGEIRGTVSTPPEFRLRQVTPEYVIGFVLDELDVPYVRRYPLLDPNDS